MSYTKKERRRMVEALKHAKTRLWNGVSLKGGTGLSDPYKFSNICSCLPSGEGGSMMESEISYRLGRHLFVDGWLAAQPGVVLPKRMSPEYDRQVQAYRLAWVNSMIKEFSC